MIRRLLLRLRTPRTIVVKVTADHIARGVQRNITKCPLALAVREVLTRGRSTAGYLGVTNSHGAIRPVYVDGVPTSSDDYVTYGPEELERWMTFIKRFDEGERVEPTTFVLNRDHIRVF